MKPHKAMHSHEQTATIRSPAKNLYSRQHHRVKQLLNTSRLRTTAATHHHSEKQLPAQTRLNMEALFQQDLSTVTINKNSSKAVNLGANAYTRGSQIHFAPGHYNPQTRQGKKLIAHELTHVVQQHRQPVRANNLYHGTPVNNHPALEQEADQMALKAVNMHSQDTLNTAWLSHLDRQKIPPFSSALQTIQKEDNETGFDIDYSLLPPSLQLRLWVLSLDANTSRVRLSRDFGSLSAGLNYNYGGALSADISGGGFRGSFGVDPSTADLSLGGSYAGFRASATGNIGQRSFGLNLGYGSRLLPFPAELSSIFNSGAEGLGSVVGDISSAPNNPLAWYDLHSDDISTITTAVKTGMQIQDQQTSSQNFGAGLRLSYSPVSGFMIYGGVQLLF